MRPEEIRTRPRPFESPGLLRRLAPFVLGTAISLVTPFIAPTDNLALNLNEGIVFVIVAAMTAAIVVALREGTMPEWCDLLPLLGFVLSVALLRDAVDGNVVRFVPALTVMVAWVALYHPMRDVVISGTLVVVSELVTLFAEKPALWIWISDVERLVVLVILALAIARLVARVDLQHRQLAAYAMTDPLTGLANRRAMEGRIASEIRRAQRRGGSFVLGVLDLDEFKKINTGYGEAAGDDLLRLCASLWSEHLSPGDGLARLGSDEFVVLIPDTGLNDATLLCDRMRRSTPKVMCSAGVARWDGEDSVREILVRAQAALHEAKQRGGGVTEISTGTPLTGNPAIATIHTA